MRLSKSKERQNMKPILIFRHAATEGPGYLATFLNNKNIPWELIKVDEKVPLPVSIKDFSGMVLMGGPMSVNDVLPWIAPILALIDEARSLDIPLLGHCLGGQLISKAFGAEITINAIKEIGWGEVTVSTNEIAKSLFGDLAQFNSFHWHGETFSLPSGATHLLSSPYCLNQAYSLGKHLAFQCHIEMTADMIKTWCEVGESELNDSASSAAVQNACDIQENLSLHVLQLNKVANQVYSQWIKGLAA